MPERGAFMPGSWPSHYLAMIERKLAGMPAAATLAERVAAVRELGPGNGTSTGRKAWQKARRAYLSGFGYQSKRAADAEPMLPLSPLERAAAATAAHERRLGGENGN